MTSSSGPAAASRFARGRRTVAHAAMIGLVAVVVATVILVFFGIGYALGRLFL
jgi:hypothetical protein